MFWARRSKKPQVTTAIEFDGVELQRNESESVLDALLRHGVDADFLCRNGTCLTCMQRAVRGDIPGRAQKGLKDTLCQRGYFLPCVCFPEGDLKIASEEDDSLYASAVVAEVKRPAPTVCQMTLEPSGPFDYRAGQFINLRRDDGLVRSYSLATVPSLDPHLELHVKLFAGGRMSEWVFNKLESGDRIEFQGPNGSCFYTPSQGQRPMLLIGNGTGLAPLLGIVRDALNDPGYDGEIYLYHGSRHIEGLYLLSHMRDLAERHRDFRYVPCLSGPDVPHDIRKGRADKVAFSDHPDLSGWRIFLCGAPPMVTAARKTAYLQGAEMLDIHTDPFELQQAA